MRQRLIYLIALFLPLESLGPEISGFVLTPALLVGLIYGVLVFNIQRVSRVLIAMLMMLIGFLVTSLGRHPPESYVMSLLALGAVLIPVSSSLRDIKTFRAFSSGFVAGLVFTLGLVAVEISTQIVGASEVYESIIGNMRNSTKEFSSHNFFGAYYRPYGMTSEPAHLALYLVSSFVFLDVSDTKGPLRSITLLAILLTGSISGILLLAAYLIARSLFALRERLRLSYSRVIKSGVYILVAAATMTILWSSLADPVEQILRRISSTVVALQQIQLSGSGASRVNAYVALTTYWEQEGLLGMLFGTGYANYSDWVEANFIDAGVLSALARGDVNNIMIAVGLSTGLLGLLLFFNVLRTMFDSNSARLLSPIGVFALSFQFFYGGLVSYFYWFLLFAVLTAAKFRFQER